MLFLLFEVVFVLLGFCKLLEPNRFFTLEIYSWLFVVVFTSQLIKNNKTAVYINRYKNN